MSACQYGTECPRPAVLRVTLARTPTAVLTRDVCLRHLAEIAKHFEVLDVEDLREIERLTANVPAWLLTLPTAADLDAMARLS